MFKNLDRTSVIIVIICLVLIFSWNYIFGPAGLNLLPVQKPQTAQTSEVQETEVSQQQTEHAGTESAATLQDKESSQAKTAVAENIKTYPEAELESPDKLMSITIDPTLGSLSKVSLNTITNSTGKENIILGKYSKPGALSVTDKDQTWEASKIYPPILNNETFSYALKRKLKDSAGKEFILDQKWIAAENYVTKYSFAITNISSGTLKLPQIMVWTGGIPPIEYLSGDAARSESHIIDTLLFNNSMLSIKVDDKSFSKQAIQTEPIKWVAISDKYFADILKSMSNDGLFSGGNYNSRYQVTENIDGANKTFWVGSSAGVIKNIFIPPNTTMTWNFEYYSGPKDIGLLNSFAPKATYIMHLAFTGIETIAQWLLYFLIFLHKYLGNYGWAIIALTVIVKLIFWPITHKSNVSMKKMQKVQPAVKELREKYKDDKQKLNQKMMELYKKEGVNPLGGCLPILVQIPVFFALYWTLDGAIELRHQSFLWAADLTQPDTIGHIFSIPINPLAIVMALTMVLQQKLTPVATDPIQAKMMMFMPLIMLIFLYNLPSGLTLYWTVSQIISIIQLLYNKYSDKNDKKIISKPKTA